MIHRMKTLLVLILALAACRPTEKRFSSVGPFRPGSLKIHVAQDSPLLGYQSARSDNGATIYMNPVPDLTEAHLRRIAVGRGRGDDHILFLTFNEEGAARLARVTTLNVGKRLAIVIDGRVVTAPELRTEITAGDAVIEGGFTKEEAERLAMLLSGSSP